MKQPKWILAGVLVLVQAIGMTGLAMAAEPVAPRFGVRQGGAFSVRPSPTPSAELTRLDTEILSATTLYLEWDEVPGRCTVTYAVDGMPYENERGTTGSSMRLSGLLPGRTYHISVRHHGTDQILTQQVELPEAERFREKGFRVTKNRIYRFSDRTRDLWEQSYSMGMNATAGQIRENIDAGQVYAIYFEIVKNKSGDELIVMPDIILLTPQGALFDSASLPMAFPGGWDAARYYVEITDLIGECLYADALVPGDYIVAVHHQGLMMGASTFTVEPAEDAAS